MLQNKSACRTVEHCLKPPSTHTSSVRHWERIKGTLHFIFCRGCGHSNIKCACVLKKIKVKLRVDTEFLEAHLEFSFNVLLFFCKKCNKNCRRSLFWRQLTSQFSEKQMQENKDENWPFGSNIMSL